MTSIKRPLHIIHTEASGGWGGQELRILTESVCMLERGHRVTLLCPGDVPLFTAAKARGIRTVSLPIGKKSIVGLKSLSNWLQENPADLINTHSSTDSWLTALACARRHWKPPVIRTRHVSTPISNNLTTRWLYTRATDFIVTTGKQLRESMIQTNRFSPSKIVSVPTGVDPETFQPGDRVHQRRLLGLPEDKTLVGIVATMRDWKGHDDLVDAWTQPNSEHLHLLIVGDGPRRGHIENRIDRAGIRHQVTMAGHQDDVVPWLQAMDIFVLPSYANEGVPQSIVQAMMSCLPVISTPIGSIEEAVQHRRTGLIIPPRNIKSLSEAIQTLATSAELRQQYGIQGRQHALKHFCLSTMVDAMEHVFYDCLTTR